VGWGGGVHLASVRAEACLVLATIQGGGVAPSFLHPSIDAELRARYVNSE
jgi:hypothetical protein